MENIENKIDIPAVMVKPRVSQTLLKALTAYHHEDIKDCGLKIVYQFFGKKVTKSSPAMKLGIYFEYQCTGYAPSPEQIPQAEKVYVNTSKEKLAAEYERANNSAWLFKEILKIHRIKVLKYAVELEHDGSRGLIDIIANVNGQDSIIDLKYTALIDDKFSEYGWHTASLPYKSMLMIQPIHYKYLAKQVYGKEYPFYFFIFNSKNELDAKLIRVNVQEEQMELHESVTIKKAKSYLNYYFENPDKLEARPNYRRCMDCSFYNICDKKAVLPLIEDINI